MTATAAAYGFRIEGLGATPWLALEGAEAWPALPVEPAAAGGPAEMVHPGLSRAAIAEAAAHGLEGLHAGALVGAAGAWIVIGVKEAGKSTLLGAAALAGLRVLADDVVFLRGTTCLGSPRCVDLRLDAGERLGAGEPVRPADPRRRITLPPEAAEHALAGFVHLTWSEGPGLQRLPASGALARLVNRAPREHFPRDPTALLDLGGFPAYELSRPPDWNALDPCVALLAAELELS